MTCVQKGAPGAEIRSFALITSIAYSVANFRGPLIKALVASGIRVYALAPDYDPVTRQAVLALGAEPVDFSLERTGMRPLRDSTDLMRLAHLLRQLNPDATLAIFAKPVIYGSIAAQLAGIKRRFSLIAGLGYVFTPNGEGVTIKRRILQRIVSLLYRVALAACDRVFFQNPDDITDFVSQRLLPATKAIRLNGTGVDLDRLSVTPLQSRPVTFLLMARLLREKGICDYVDAARRVKVSYSDTRFILLGGLDSNPGALTHPEVKAWAHEGIIEWPGHVNDVRPWIEQASVYVLPSYREGVPRSTQEAMAMGRPVITTDAVGCRETVVDGVNGFLIPIRDPEALAQAMLRFIENPELIKTMGRESRRLAEERFNVHTINAKILATMGISSHQP